MAGRKRSEIAYRTPTRWKQSQPELASINIGVGLADTFKPLIHDFLVQLARLALSFNNLIAS